MKIQPDVAGADDPGKGRRLGLDIGTVRIGVAKSDVDGLLATPVETIHNSEDTPATLKALLPIQNTGEVTSAHQRVFELVQENFIVEVVVGLPVSLQGQNTASTTKAINFAQILKEIFDQLKMNIPVRFVDERMSTMAATQALQASGVNAKKGRKVIDQAAAVHILQTWLDQRKNYITTL